MVRSGGKVCWPTGGIIPPIPEYTETEVLLQAKDSMQVNSSPYNTAILRQITMAPNLQSFHAVEFNAIGATPEARAWNISNRWITKPGTGFYVVNGQINALCDNASLNNVSFEVFYYSQSYPAYDYDSAVTTTAPIIVAATGTDKAIRFNFQFTIAGDLVGIGISRRGAGDTNPGKIYVPNLLLYFNQAIL